MRFRDFNELVAKVTEYEEILMEKSQQRKTSMGTYYQEVNSEEIIVTDLLSIGSSICFLLVKKTADSWKKLQISNT